MVYLSRRAATFLMDQAARLFRVCAGMSIDSAHEYDVDWDAETGLIDEVSDEDSHLKFWMNGVLILTRSLYGILKNAIEEVDAARVLSTLNEISEDEF